MPLLKTGDWVVKPNEFVPVFKEWAEQHRTRFAKDRGKYYDPLEFNVQEYVYEHTGVSKHTVRALLKPEYPHNWIAYDTVEKLLILIGHEYLLTTMEIYIWQINKTPKPLTISTLKPLSGS